jgi:ribose transport system permease protein
MSEPRRKSVAGETITLIVFFVLLACVAGAFAGASPSFRSAGNVVNLLKHMAPVALVGLGLTFVLAVGFADMSFQYVCCLSGMTMSYLIARGLPPMASVLIGCLVGMAFGAINGVLVGRLRLPDMVASIGVGSIAWSLAYLYSGGAHIYENFLTSGIRKLNDSRPLGVPLPTVIMAVAYGLGYLLLHRSKWGRRFYAIGSNEVAARFSGINVGRYVTAAFVLCGVLASLTNMIKIAAQGNGNVKGGLAFLMPAYATVFVGISVFKKVTVGGTFLGALLIAVMQNGFTSMSKPVYYMNFAVGLVLIVAIVISKIDFKEILRRRRLRSELARGEAAP